MILEKQTKIKKLIYRKLAAREIRFRLYTEDAPEKATEIQFQDIEGAVSKT